MLENQIILVRDDRITAVGKTVAIPSGAEIIELSSLTVLSGLIDCHTHLADGMHDPNGDPLSYPKKRRPRSPSNLFRMLVPRWKQESRRCAMWAPIAR